MNYYAITQGTKASGLWQVFSKDENGKLATVRKDLDFRQATELVWRLMKGLD